MLALILARPGPICDGLVALLRARPDVRKIVQTTGPIDALDFAQTIHPDITLVHTSSLSQGLVSFITQIKKICDNPLLMIVAREEDRKTAITQGADIVIMEGLSSEKLAIHITTLLQQYSETKSVEFAE
jgi:DNA-binding NarL/FixJ family response regulator